MQNLLNDYKPITNNDPAKPLDSGDIKNLMEQDPAWASRMERKYAENTVSSNMRTSFSNESFSSGGITAAPLTTAFSNCASPPAATPANPASAPVLEKRQQNLNSTLQSAGF